MKIAVRFTLDSKVENIRIPETIFEWKCSVIPSENDLVTAKLFKEILPQDHELTRNDLQVWSVAWQVIEGKLMPVLHLSDYHL
jgi:hypothetical protein